MTSRPERDGKLPLTELQEMTSRGDPIVMVTAYDFPSGRLADAAGMDIVLVGDSAAMTILGHSTTVPATMEEMLMLTRAVTRGARRPIVVADMPFGSFQVSDEDAVRNAILFVKDAAADAVKLEGAGPSLSRVVALVGAGIPVMGHIGLTPQSATMLGGFRAQGRTAEKARRLLDEAIALEEAGCFALVLEAVPAPVAARISETLVIPTIGIGSGAECDGQVLVLHDLSGSTTAGRRASRSATRISAATSAPRSSASGRECAPALPGRGAHLRDAEEELEAFLNGSLAARQRNHERKREHEDGEHGERHRDARRSSRQRSTTEIRRSEASDQRAKPTAARSKRTAACRVLSPERNESVP